MIVSYSNCTGDYSIQVAKLLRLSMPGYPFPDFLYEEKVTNDPDFDADLTRVGISEGEIVSFIMGVIRQREKGPEGYIKFIAVHPEFQRKGIGKGMLAMIEGEFKKRSVKSIKVFESYPNYYMPGIDAFFTPAISFFERSGYSKFNDTANMTVQLTDGLFDISSEIEGLRRNGIIVRRALDNDRDHLLAWIKKHFFEWQWEVMGSFDNDPISTFIAVKESNIIGFSSYEANNCGTGWFGPMGTDSTFRGLSIGTALLKLCLNSMAEMGFSKAIIPWVGPIPFYSKAVNAKIDKIFWRYEKSFEA